MHAVADVVELNLGRSPTEIDRPELACSYPFTLAMIGASSSSSDGPFLTSSS